MSIYNQYADKPWMRPPMYTNDADASHGAGPSRVTELVNGEAVVIDGREHYQPTEFGDGRPTSTPDQTPMIYRQPYSEAVIDLDDQDELDTAPPEYVPQHHYERHFENVIPRGGLPAHLQPQPQQASKPAKEAISRHPRLNVDMLGVYTSAVVVDVGGSLFEANAEELKLAANFFVAWAKMLSAIRN